jgi:hypothetical protein
MRSSLGKFSVKYLQTLARSHECSAQSYEPVDEEKSGRTYRGSEDCKPSNHHRSTAHVVYYFNR